MAGNTRLLNQSRVESHQLSSIVPWCDKPATISTPITGPYAHHPSLSRTRQACSWAQAFGSVWQHLRRLLRPPFSPAKCIRMYGLMTGKASDAGLFTAEVQDSPIQPYILHDVKSRGRQTQHLQRDRQAQTAHAAKATRLGIICTRRRATCRR